MIRRFPLALLLVPSLVLAEPPQPVQVAPRLLTLEAALTTARTHHPDARQAHAGTDAVRARADVARSPLLPQVFATTNLQARTSNVAPQPGSLPSQFASRAGSLAFSPFLNVGINATLLLYDFGQTSERLAAARSNTAAAVDNERTALVRIGAGVRSAWYAAQATQALWKVAEDALANQDKHLLQVEAFVEVGRRPQIDLAQARADRSNAQVQVIAAQTNALQAKAQLVQAMGLDEDADFQLSEEPVAVVPGEDQKTAPLLNEAVQARPEVAQLQHQVEAQERTLAAIRGAYGPSIVANTGLTDAGTSPTNLTWNLSAGLGVSWPIFQGGLTDAQVREARANVVGLQAQLTAERQRIRLEVEQARLGVHASLAALGAADDALVNAKVRLELAEGRYQAGAGSIIELADAQLAATNAAAQRVQAEFRLGTARAQLLQALGRP
jgi:outer membrane protein